ncbi:hypothetical protein OVS_04085 [Mycoplasma ovis str. Michigan]|uniref:Uncharacterized protein n=1 Tax=Mycoplasma ovis str. Michigan TaxID=1415773 RepID=A0ABN4BRL5_9MOLU|nr:hypothetical protein [Mycoplasma ovis]AHC40548.1 hypothetical protein OVS_04085 [Mycoplasma ovis str. Michigan]
MILRPASLAIVVVFSSAVPWIFMKNQGELNSSNNPSLVVKTEKEVKKIDVDREKIDDSKGNCEVIQKQGILDNGLWEDGLDDYTYLTVSCQDTNKDPESTLPNKWIGMFPETLIKQRKQLTIGKKLEIKLESKSWNSGKVGENTGQVTITGNRFRSTLIGDWEEDIEGVGVKKINITSPSMPKDKIYLLPLDCQISVLF